MNIGGWEKTSLSDYNGEIATVLFTVGCNMICKFCYNRDLLSDEYFSKSNRSPIYEKEIFEYIDKYKNMLTAITITGGEPTIHIDLPEFCQKIKKLNKKIKIDTNGTNPEMIIKLLRKGLVDYIAMDIKGPLAKYKQITGIEAPENILKSIDIIKECGIPHEFRLTMYSELTKDDIVEAIKLVSDSSVFLQHFDPKYAQDPHARTLVPIPREDIDYILAQTKNIANVVVR